MSSPGPQPRVTPRKILDVFRQQTDPCAPLTASEVAGELECARRTAYTKLRALAKQGELASKKTGARGRIWWQPWHGTAAGRASARADEGCRKFTALADAVSEYAVFELDAMGRVASWNESARQLSGYARSEIIGTHVSVLYTDDDSGAGVPERHLRTAAERGRFEDEGWRVRTDGSRFRANAILSALSDERGDLDGFLAVIKTVSEERESDRFLRMENELLEQLFDTSPLAIAVVDQNGQVTRANARAEKVLGLTRSAIEGRMYDAPEWNTFREDGRPITPEEHPVTHVLATGESVFGFVHGITLPDGTNRWLSSNSAPVLDSDGGVERVVVALEDITELKRHEQAIEIQRNELAHLKRVNEVVRGIDRAIVKADSQATIETAVCDQIAASEPYLFAVIGTFSSSYESFTVRSSAGVGEGYLDRILHSDETPPLSEGIGAEAARTGEVQVAQQLTDLPYDLWQETADQHGFQSYASIPLVHEDVVYGVLGVYAERPDNFDDAERKVLGELGDMIGHAINALERKEALLADTIVELEFRDTGSFADFFEGIDGDAGKTSQVERTVVLDDGDVLQYYSISGFDIERFTAALERLASVRQVRILDRRGETATVEARMAGPTLASVLARYGGRTKRTEFADGTVRVTTTVPYGTDVRQVIDAVQELYPDMEFVSRATRRRATEPTTGLREEVADRLTDRQRTALEAGYYAGFFDWPRESTGEALADTMDIAPSTLHKHIRYGERKILRLLFDPENSA